MQPNPYINRCGNSVIESANDNEECDDGLELNSDASRCTSECKIAICGDGLVQIGVEQCDNGEGNHTLGPCSPTCELINCGDGILQPGEECDRGDANQLSPSGYDGCSTACTIPACGDGILQENEQCDDANTDDTDACPNDCRLAKCGDGIVQPNEECDDANTVNTDNCTNDCAHAVCGDGIVHTDVEECDDNNSNNHDDCLNACIAARCGDGVVKTATEDCDDANDIDTDGCNSACGRDRLVFLTDELNTPYELVGLIGADIECRKAALDHGIANYDDFKVWLSDSTGSPATRFVRAKGRYVLPTGEVVALDWDDLTDGKLLHAIDTTLDGEVLDQGVWTNTDIDGTAFGDDDEDCGDWTTIEGLNHSYVAFSGSTDTWWTHFEDMIPCDDALYLYCFEN